MSPQASVGRSPGQGSRSHVSEPNRGPVPLLHLANQDEIKNLSQISCCLFGTWVGGGGWVPGGWCFVNRDVGWS